MMSVTLVSVQVGQVVAVEGDQVRVKLSREFLQSAQHERLGQPGGYALIEAGHSRLVGLITELRLDEDDVDEGQGWMVVHLFGQIVSGRFVRGVTEYPVIFDPVVLPGEEDLSIMLGGGTDPYSAHAGSLLLGRSAVNSDYPVYLNGEHFFSKHAAVVGNSGSGKSCTIARIVTEAIEQASSQIILFDLHGEYRQAFSDADGVLQENVTYVGERDLVLPYWLLRYRELEALFIDRSDPQLIANQNSLLKEAIRRLKRPAAKKLGLLDTYTLDTPIHYSLDQLKVYADNMNDARFVLNTNRYAFSRSALRNLSPPEQEELLLSQRTQFNQGNAEGEIPHALYYHKLIGLIDRMEHKLNDRRYDFLLRPIEHARSSPLFAKHFPQVLKKRTDWTELIEWLIRIIMGHIEPRRNLTIVDLSGIPFDMIDLTVGLLTRIIFDYNFYSSRENRVPVVLIFEEAHNYIPVDNHRDSFARAAVERVAKEGRKYGVSALVVSQRPSELSHTVLSQCNNLIVMRLSNPEDQAYIAKIVSDQFADLIKMLPVLSPGEGFVIGDSVPFPMRTMVALPNRLPASGNVNFIQAWAERTDVSQLHDSIDRWLHQTRPNTTPNTTSKTMSKTTENTEATESTEKIKHRI